MGRSSKTPNPLIDRPSLPRMLWRGARLRCPWCGGRGWRRGWFGRFPRCQSCGYRYERQEGFSLGAVTMNLGLTLVLVAVVLVVGMVLTYPDIATVPIAVAAVAVAALVPVAFYPASSTIWAAVDLAMRPLEPAELADAAAAVASGEVPGREHRRP